VTEVEDALTLAQRIDGFFEVAARESFSVYGEGAQEVFEELYSLTPFKGAEFVEAYRAGGIYPDERLTELVKRFADVRLPMEYLHFSAGLANEFYYGPISDEPRLAGSPHLKLRLMAIDHSVIGHSRTAWEKLMRAIHFLETGNELKPSGSRSYKGKFFDWVAKQPKWLFLEPYKTVVTKHDDRYRTGEYHKGSILRPRILGIETATSTDFLELANYMRNCIWPNILAIVAGHWPYNFTDLHAPEGVDYGIDPRYLQPAE
jgi:hypothetical protein